jgi:GPI mannosyltransferase 3
MFGERFWLYTILGVAFALRATVAVTQHYVQFPDEIFQYYEQAHRLVFGSGVVPWEFHDGARSWLLPGILAGIMEVTAWFNPNSLSYIDAIRVIASLVSLSVVWVAFKLGLRSGGLGAAVICGTLAAIWFDAVRFAPSVMTEIAAAYPAFGAVWLAERRDPSDTPNAMAFAGILLGLSFSLRFQMAPTLLVIAAFHCRREWSRRWLPLVLSGAATIAVLLGLLDFVTWGAPFQSLVVNYVRNIPQGLSTAIATAPLDQYFVSLFTYWTPWGLLLAALIPLGAVRAPALATAAAVTVLVHSLLGHKEYRFIFFALLSAPILIGLGATRLFELIGTGWSAREKASARAAFLAVCAYASAIAWFEGGGRVMRDFTAGTLESFLAAHDQSGLCGLGVMDIGWARTGGYAFLNRDVPLYYAVFHNTESVVESMRRHGVELKLTVEFRGRDLPQYDGDDFARHVGAFNYLVAKAHSGLPGFEPEQCFANSPYADYPTVCLYRRPGTCDAVDEKLGNR